MAGHQVGVRTRSQPTKYGGKAMAQFQGVCSTCGWHGNDYPRAMGFQAQHEALEHYRETLKGKP